MSNLKVRTDLGRFQETHAKFCDTVREILAVLAVGLEGPTALGAKSNPIFSLAFHVDEKVAYQQPIYFHRKTTDGKTEAKLLFVLRCSYGLSSERRYLAFRVLDEVAAELRALLFEYGEERLDDAISSAKEKAQEILLRAHNQISAEMHESLGFSFRELDSLSLTDYEKERAGGSLLFLAEDPVKYSAAFDWMVHESDVIFAEDNLRMIRKLLAGVTPDAYGQTASTLVFAKTERPMPAKFYGAASLLDGVPIPTLRTKSAQVSIYGPLKWELSICGYPICRREARGLIFCTASSGCEAEKKKEEEIREALQKAFGLVRKMDQLVDIVRAVEKQRHGAAVLVADWRDGVSGKNLEDLTRDSKSMQVFWSNSKADRRGVITNAAKMDGAVLADVNCGKVVALATIMQAATCAKGKASRGSRYNSINNAVCSLCGQGGKVVAFVFSSDGGMDILPQHDL